MNFLKEKIVQLVIILIFINILKITILKKIKIIVFIQDMKQILVNNYNLSSNYINYKEEHYNEGLKNILKNKEQEEIDLIARKNLDLINKLSEV